ncbi:hypothetical protein ACFE04_024989 [Oxalis oulophora]
MRKSKSCTSIIDRSFLLKREERKRSTAGCFSVYVGQDKQRFVIKTEYINHPLFRILLEEAESEYGFISDGPLVLPCKVDLFYKVLFAMEDSGRESRFHGCASPRFTPKGYHLLTSPVIGIN